MLRTNTPRRPLALISGNTGCGKDISPYIKGRVIEAKVNNTKISQIIEKFKLSRGAIRSIINNDSARIEGTSFLKSGKPKKYTIRQLHALTRYIKNNPKDIYGGTICLKPRNTQTLLSNATSASITSAISVLSAARF
jgi:hypothetical protein